jgi:mannose-1-phosphate guanylyltransferase
MLYSVVIAGGSGTRLWPLSRAARPKQLIRFGDRPSLLRQALDRLRPWVPAERTLVVTLREHLPALRAEAPELAPENLLGEPMGRNTAAAIGWAAEVLFHRDPEAVLCVVPADHVIRPAETVHAAFARAAEIVAHEPWALVAFGIRPRSPHTGYGYLHLGDALPGGQPAAHRLLGFREKPDAATAQQFLAGGRHRWNSGMFVFRADTLRERLGAAAPQIAAGVRSWCDGRRADADYAAMPSTSIDYAVMEPSAAAGLVRAVDLDVDWHDVGSFAALAAVIEPDAGGNVIAADTVVPVNAVRNVIVAEPGHAVAVVGLEGVVVVQTADATLVCRASEAERVKEAVEQLRRRGLEKFL